MKIRIWMRFIKANLAALMLLGLFAALWWDVQPAASFEPDEAYASSRTLVAIRQAARAILKPGDEVFLSSQDALLRQTIGELGASFYQVDASDASGMEAPLLQIVNKYCKRDQVQGTATAYWVWTTDNERTSMLLGSVARALNFFFAFQAVVPYRGDNAFAIDKFPLLQPKETIVRSYCEATKQAGGRPVVVILDSGGFSPWIGSVVTGQVTWLASDPRRDMDNSEFAVVDMPPLLTYDVYWMGQVPLFPHWRFTNQDMSAYQLAVRRGEAQDSVVLVDRNAKLGITALRYLGECHVEDFLPTSSLFRQMCFKNSRH